MNFLLVDVKNITPSKSFEEIDKTKVEKLADSILECDGLLKPLVLKPTGPESYIVIEGNMEYYAAVKAREKDPRKGEMVNAFVILPKVEEAIFKQLQTLQNIKVTEKPSVPKATPFQALQSVQNEVKNIAGKISSLPSQLDRAIQQMERKFQAFFNERLTQLENNLAPLKPSPVVVQTGGYWNKTVKELKALIKEMGIKGYSKLKKPELVDVLEKNDMT